MSDKYAAIAQFVELTGVDQTVAESLLERNNFEVELALEEFYNGPTQREAAPSVAAPNNPQQGPFEGQSSASRATNTKKQSTRANTATGQASRFKSFSQLASGEGSDDEEEKNFFSGGAEGSGINVEKPNSGPRNIVQDLLKKAEEGGGHPDRSNDEESGSSSKPSFDGVGYKLGDSLNPSEQIGNTSHAPKKLQKATREITFWKDGFQVGDGKLYRYDDPANATYLAELNSGRAPLSLLNVEYGQDVDVNVSKRLDEEYKPPPRKLGGFHGQGQRLGSPVSPDYQSPQPDIPTPPIVQDDQESKPEEIEGDASVQIRFADGRRIVRKFQSSASVEAIFDFVKTQSTDSREFTLNHAFPVKPIEDLSQSIIDAGLINAVIVQRWK